MSLPAPKAVIYDWDNTLVNTWPIIHEALNKTFAQTGMPAWTIADTMKRVRKSMRDSFPEIFGPNWQDAGKLYQQHYRENHLNWLEALPKAEEVLKLVQSRGLPQLVVSNKKGGNLRMEVAHLDWGHYFDAVIGADDAARDKPHPDPVHLALSSLEMLPHPSIWFIGDSDIDLETAAACNCTPILYGPHAHTQPEYSPTHYFGHPYMAHAHDHEAVLQLLQA